MTSYESYSSGPYLCAVSCFWRAATDDTSHTHQVASTFSKENRRFDSRHRQPILAGFQRLTEVLLVDRGQSNRTSLQGLEAQFQKLNR